MSKRNIDNAHESGDDNGAAAPSAAAFAQSDTKRDSGADIQSDIRADTADQALPDADPAPNSQRFIKPSYWTNDPPPKAGSEKQAGESDPAGLSPTRYGDWVVKGIAIDF